MKARLYVRDGCELCDEARELLRPFEHSRRLKLEVVDIAADRDLLLRYDLVIPVLEIEGGDTLAWPFSRVELRRTLR